MGYFRNVECPREMGRDFIFHVKRETPLFKAQKFSAPRLGFASGRAPCGAREVKTGINTVLTLY